MAIAAMAGQQAGNAAEYIYSPVNGANDLWSDGTNWSAAPLSSELTQLTFVGNNATILANGLTNTNVNTLAPFSLKALNLQGTGPSSDAATINISSAVSGGGYLNLTAPAGIFGYPVVNLNAMAGTAGLTYDVASNLNLATSAYFQGNGTATFNFSGAISGNGGIIKSGSSSLTLSGANTFSGVTAVTQGTLVLAHSNALQNSTLDYLYGGELSFGNLTSATLGGLKTSGSLPTLTLTNANGQPVALSVGNNNQSTTYNGIISGSGSLIKVGTGTLSLIPGSSSNWFSGDIRIDTGTIAFPSNVGFINTIELNGGGFTFGTSPTFGGLGGLKGSGDLNLNDTMVQVGYNNQSTTYSGQLSGSMSLSKVGSGSLTLSGANTFTGVTAVTQGTLVLAHSNALQNSTLDYLYGGELSFGNLTSATLGGLKTSGSLPTLTLTNANGQPVALSVGNNNQSTTYSGTISGSGSLIKVGTGTLSLIPGSPSNWFSGDIRIDAGTIALPSYYVTPNTVELNGGGFTFGTSPTFGGLGGLKGSGDLNLNDTMVQVGYNNQSTTYSGQLSGSMSLSKVGSGSLTLSGANTFTGVTAVTQGTLVLAHSNALQNSTLDYLYGGELSFGNLTSATLGGLKTSGSLPTLTLTNANGQPVALSVGNNNQSTTYSGTISGSGSLIKVGTGTLSLIPGSPSNWFSGDIRIDAGTIALPSYYVTPNTVELNGGGFTFGTSPAIGGLGGLKGSGNLNLNDTMVQVGFNNQSTTYSGQLSGSMSLTKLGTGSLTLSGANQHTGDTCLNGGTLGLANANALQNSTLDYHSGELAFGNLTSATLGGLKTSSGNVPTLTLTNANGQPVALSVGNNNQSTSYSGIISGSGSLIKVGTGTLSLMPGIPSNWFSGDIRIDAGTIALPSYYVTPNTVELNGGGFTFGTSPAIGGLGGLKGSGNLNLNDTMVQVGFNNQSTTYSGQLSGSMSLTKLGTGSLTLSGANQHTGDTCLNGGTLGLANANALQNSTLDYYSGELAFGNLTSATLGGLKTSGSLPTLTLTNANGQPVALSVGNNNQSTTYSGTITGSGSLNKIGAGTLTLTKQCSYAGPTAISEGTLALGTNKTLPTSSTLFLDGGTLATNGYSQTLGGLTVADDSCIDFGDGSSWLLLADSHLATWSGDLTILNWSGSESGLGTDKIKFGSSVASLTADQLRHIFFVDPYGLTGTFGATMLSTGEVVALPEPTTWSLAIAGMLFGIFVWRRQQSTFSA